MGTGTLHHLVHSRLAFGLYATGPFIGHESCCHLKQCNGPFLVFITAVTHWVLLGVRGISHKTLYGDCIVMCDSLQHLPFNYDVTVSRYIQRHRLTSHYTEMLVKLDARPHLHTDLFCCFGGQGSGSSHSCSLQSLCQDLVIL